MKKLLLIIVAAYSFSFARAQSTVASLQFDTHFYDLVDHWVAFPKNAQTGKYTLGFVYLDFAAGFSFHMEGNFQADAQGKIYRDSSDYIKNSMMIVRLGPNTKLVAAIPDDMLNTLTVKPVPDWLAIYKRGNADPNSVAYKVMMGKHLNSAGATAKALTYLESAYQTEPHATGLDFELTYSYNDLKQYDKAITILQVALKNEPKNALFYRELAYAYVHSNDYENAIKYYLQGLEPDKAATRDTKAEMAWNLATIYRAQKNVEEFKKWGQKAKEWADPNSQLGKGLSTATFN